MTDSKTTKRALAASIGCMALCVVLLVGTTFAWFTDTASTSVSQVTSGTLDVELYYANNATGGEGSEWTKAGDSTTLYFLQSSSEGTVSQGANILWEPGCTYSLPALQVKNSGSLALKYKIEITGIKGDAKLNEAIEWTINDEKLDSDHSLAAGATSGALTIKGHMKEDAGNEYQDLSIEGITISVVATQDTVEYDSASNTYDEKAEYATPVSSVDELKTALASGEDVVLTKDLEIPNSVDEISRDVIALEIKSDVTIYGNGKTKLKFTGEQTDGRVINVNDNTGGPVTLTLSGVEIVGPTMNGPNRGISVYGNSDVNIVMDNCTASANHYALNIASGNNKVNVTVRNSTLTGYSAFQTYSANTNATFENCTLTGVNQWAVGSNDYAAIVILPDAANSNLTFTNCRIEAKMTDTATEYLLSARNGSSQVTFDGCTFSVTDKDSTTATELTSTDDVMKHVQNQGNATITIK